jgi:molybdenum cofactor cytidylyltransferase
MIPDAGFPLGVVMLAAGTSSRMGRSKLLLPWRDMTVIATILARWRELGAEQIAAVCRPDDAALLDELDRAKHPCEHRIYNAESGSGMFTSIRLAARWNGWSGGLTHWAITLGDQPHLSRAMLSALIDSARQSDRIFQPAYHDHARHPIVLPRKYFLALANTPHQTMKEFLVAHASSVMRLEVDDPAVELDIDTPEDYRSAVERFGGQ